MAQMTYLPSDQHYSKYIFRNIMSHNLQRAEENGDNTKFCWIDLITPLLFLCKQFYKPKLKFIITISSLIHFTIASNAFSVSFNIVLSWVSNVLPQTNFLQWKCYISPTKLMNILHTCTRNYSPSTKWNVKAIVYTWKWHYFC